MLQLLLSVSDINNVSTKCEFALYSAIAQDCRVEVIELLVVGGSMFETKIKSALWCAIESIRDPFKCQKVLLLLLNAGADVNWVSVYGT